MVKVLFDRESLLIVSGYITLLSVSRAENLVGNEGQIDFGVIARCSLFMWDWSQFLFDQFLWIGR